MNKPAQQANEKEISKWKAVSYTMLLVQATEVLLAIMTQPMSVPEFWILFYLWLGCGAFGLLCAIRSFRLTYKQKVDSYGRLALVLHLVSLLFLGWILLLAYGTD